VLASQPDPLYTDKVSDYSKISEYTFCERVRRHPEKYRNIRETIRQRLSETRNKIINAIFLGPSKSEQRETSADDGKSGNAVSESADALICSGGGGRCAGSGGGRGNGGRRRKLQQTDDCEDEDPEYAVTVGSQATSEFFLDNIESKSYLNLLYHILCNNNMQPLRR